MTNTIRVHTIDAFSKIGEMTTGNPAGFVLNGNLTDQEMQAVAAKIGFSETAFVRDNRYLSPKKIADFTVRFFTPTDEVDLCGHATIGTFAGMNQLGYIGAKEWVQETKAGRLKVQITKDGTVLMEQAAPQLLDSCDSMREQIAASLGLEVKDLDSKLPCQVVSTGLPDLLIPVTSLKALERIVPDDEAISEISKALGITGYHVFTVVQDQVVRCRNFAPLYGIPEEAATGTSNGALTAYLIHHLNAAKAYTFIQGVEMGRPSQISGLMDASGRIWVGGKANHLDEKTVTL